MSVSNFLNGKGVSQLTREAISRAIKDLNYTPNQAARQLASAAPMFIGLVHSNDEHPVSTSLLTGALTASARLGVQLLLQPIVYSEVDQGWAAVQALRERGAEAILLPAVFGEAMADCAGEIPSDLPVICVGPASPLTTMSAIRIDDVAAAREVTSLLIMKGHDRIGMLRAPDILPGYKTRTAGYFEALREHGLPIDPDLVVDGGYTFQHAVTAAAELLDRTYQPTAIVTYNDEMAAGVLTMAHMRGLAVPAELAITGFDDSYFAQRLWPPLTSVRVPFSEMAEVAVEQLVRRLRSETANEPAVPIQTIVRHELKRRASTGD